MVELCGYILGSDQKSENQTRIQHFNWRTNCSHKSVVASQTIMLLPAPAPMVLVAYGGPVGNQRRLVLERRSLVGGATRGLATSGGD